jgi:hypothetical protein
MHTRQGRYRPSFHLPLFGYFLSNLPQDLVSLVRFHQCSLRYCI